MTDKSKIYHSSQSPEAQRSRRKRLAYKKKVDKLAKFSTMSERSLACATGDVVDIKKNRWVRLITEGALVDGIMKSPDEEEPVAFFFLKRGSLKSMMEEMPDDFVGYIDKDHIRSLYLGEFTKDDLRLVEVEDGRYAIDVNFKLNKSLNLVSDLLVEDQHRALSVELDIVDANIIESTDIDESLKAEDEPYPVIVLNEVTLKGFAVCREPKDPNAYDRELLSSFNLKGVKMDEELNKKNPDLEEKDIQAQAEDVQDDIKMDQTGEKEQSDAKDENPEAENTDIQAESSDPEEEENKSEDNEASVDANVNSIDELAKAIDELKAQNEKLIAQIAEKDEKIAALEKDLSENSVANMSMEEKIGTLLASVKVATKTEAEGNTSSTKANDENIVASYSKAFADL